MLSWLSMSRLRRVVKRSHRSVCAALPPPYAHSYTNTVKTSRNSHRASFVRALLENHTRGLFAREGTSYPFFVVVEAFANPTPPTGTTYRVPRAHSLIVRCDSTCEVCTKSIVYCTQTRHNKYSIAKPKRPLIAQRRYRAHGRLAGPIGLGHFDRTPTRRDIIHAYSRLGPV